MTKKSDDEEEVDEKDTEEDNVNRLDRAKSEN